MTRTEISEYLGEKLVWEKVGLCKSWFGKEWVCVKVGLRKIGLG